MAQATLVEMQIQEGQRLIDRLLHAGVPVTAAGWVQESESGDCYLYLATPLVADDGATRPAYREVNRVIRGTQQEGFALDPFEIKVIGPHDPIARDLMAYRRPVRKPTWFHGSRLGALGVEQALLYPPIGNPEQAAALDER